MTDLQDVVARRLERAQAQLDDLRLELDHARTQAGELRGGGLLGLDLGRTLVALSAAQLALARARRNVELG